MATKATIVKTTVGELAAKLATFPPDQVVVIASIESNASGAEINNDLVTPPDQINNDLPSVNWKKSLALYLYDKPHASTKPA